MSKVPLLEYDVDFCFVVISLSLLVLLSAQNSVFAFIVCKYSLGKAETAYCNST